MHIEVQVALNFVISYLYNKLPRRRVNIFGEELEKALKDKFQGHWYPEKPFKVSRTHTQHSPYSCILCAPLSGFHSAKGLFLFLLLLLLLVLLLVLLWVGLKLSSHIGNGCGTKALFAIPKRNVEDYCHCTNGIKDSRSAQLVLFVNEKEQSKLLPSDPKRPLGAP